MVSAPVLPRRVGRTLRASEGLALLAWLLPMTFAVLAHTGLKVISADELGMYRYTADIIAHVRDDMPIAWVVQLGPRYFPDLVLSLAAYALSLGDPRAWGAIFALLNLGLVYGALLVLLSVSGLDERGRNLVGIAFMAVLLAMIATSLQGGANLLRTTRHNALIAPAVLFYALPLLGARAEGGRRLATIVAGFGVLFGLVIHSDPLFLVWTVAPALAAALVMTIAGGMNWRGLAATVGVMLVALTLVEALRRAFYALPFLAYQDAQLSRSIRLSHLARRLSELGQDYASYGRAMVIVLGVLAVAGGALSLWATRRAPAEVRRLRLYVFALFVATARAVPAAMVIRNMLSFRYLFWGIAVAALPIAFGIADALGRLGGRRVTAGLAAVVLATGTPFFIVRAREAALRDKPEDALLTALNAAAAADRIGRVGLASYWVAHKVPLRSAFTIAPLSKTAQPFLVTSNAFDFWDWRSGCPQRRRFTFVVTARKGPQKVAPAAIEAHFGAPAGIVRVTGTAFEIWRYPDGIGAPDDLYRDLRHSLGKRSLSTRALDRCGSAGATERENRGIASS